MTAPKRMIIYPKDIQLINGKTDRHARGILVRIRHHLGKEKFQPVTVKEFCEYMKLNEEEVRKYIF